MGMRDLAAREPLVVLGIDPGTYAMGFGVIGRRGGHLHAVDHGAFRPRRQDAVGTRLVQLGDFLDRLLDHHRPDVVSLEEAFVRLNPQSALRLGEARAVVLLAAGRRKIPVVEYPTAVAKKAVCGHGGAPKEVVQTMVAQQLGLRAPPEPHDAADALALALCLLLDPRLDPRSRPPWEKRDCLPRYVAQGRNHHAPKTFSDSIIRGRVEGEAMMRQPLPYLILVCLLAAGCASTSSGGDGYEATKLKPDDEDVPEAVKAIEEHVDRMSALVAEEVEIHVSRNYEWDVALTGDAVSPQRADGEDHVSVAEGQARAQFRNLDIRAWNRITFRKSGFDVVPFIKVTARGHAAHAVMGGRGGPTIRRARVIKIENAEITFIEEQEARRSVAGARAPAGRL